MRKQWGGKEREKEILNPMFHSPDGHKGQRWARLRPGASFESATWITGAQTLEQYHTAFLRPFPGS